MKDGLAAAQLHDIEGVEQVPVVQGQTSAMKPGKVLLRKPVQRAGRPFRNHGIQRNDVIVSLKQGKAVGKRGAELQKVRARGRILGQRPEGMHAEPVVSHQNIPHADHKNGHCPAPFSGMVKLCAAKRHDKDGPEQLPPCASIFSYALPCR